VWSPEELKECNTKIWKLPFEELENAFLKFGGIPRYALDMKKFLSELHLAIQKTENVDALFKDMQDLEMAQSSSHKLLQYSVLESFPVESVRCASNYVYEELRKKWYKGNKLAEIRDFLKYEHMPERRGFCGLQWQTLARERLLQVQAYMHTYVCTYEESVFFRCKHICIPTYILRRKKIWILFESNSCLN
jgi:hypothetical protein